MGSNPIIHSPNIWVILQKYTLCSTAVFLDRNVLSDCMWKVELVELHLTALANQTHARAHSWWITFRVIVVFLQCWVVPTKDKIVWKDKMINAMKTSQTCEIPSHSNINCCAVFWHLIHLPNPESLSSGPPKIWKNLWRTLAHPVPNVWGNVLNMWRQHVEAKMGC